QLEFRSEAARRFPIAKCGRAVAARVAYRREAGEHTVQEKSEPGAFAASGRAHSVHAVIPIACAEEWKAVHASGHALLDRTDAMLEQRAVFMRYVRYAVGFVFIGG